MKTFSIYNYALLALLALCALVNGLPLAKRFGGRATYYQIGLGACGDVSYEPEWIVALNSAQYNSMGGGYPNPAVCGKEIEIHAFGKTAIARVMDECPTCSWGELDMSRSLFNHFASENDGVFNIDEWSWVGDHQAPPAPPPAPTATTEVPPPAPTSTRQAPPEPTTEAPAPSAETTEAPTSTTSETSSTSASTTSSSETSATSSSTSAESTTVTATTTSSSSWATETASRTVSPGWESNECWDCTTSWTSEPTATETASTTSDSEFTDVPEWIQVESSSTDSWYPTVTEEAPEWNAWAVSGAEARNKVPGSWVLWVCLLLPAILVAL